MRNRIILSLLFGLLMGMSLPMQWGHWVPPNLGWLAWIALVPLMIAVRGLTPWRAYWVAFVGAFLGHAFIVYWIYTALYTYGHLPVAGAIVVLGLALLGMTVVTATAPAVVCFIEKRRGPTLWAWPLAWAVMEIAHNYVPVGGFTYCNLIHSQYKYPILFQIVNIVGPYWFLAVMVLVNVTVAQVVQALCHPEGKARRICTWRSFASLRMTILIFAILLSYGAYSRHHYQTATRTWPLLRVALLQGNIPQEEKWDAHLAEKNFNTYRLMSWEASSSQPDLIIWPEASYPWSLNLKTKAMPQNLQLPDTPIIIGSVTHDGNAYYNSALMLNDHHDVTDVVHKSHLVPYGEYVPFKKYLTFLKAVTAEAGDMLPAETLRPLMMDGMPLGMLICYEDIFPEIARKLVADGSVLLVNITNDAWYGWSPAAMQHTAASVFRAAENGRYLVRATNTGVSAVIEPDGSIQLASSLYERAVIVAGVRLGLDHTLYNRYGKWGDLLLPFTLLLMALVVRITPTRKKTHP